MKIDTECIPKRSGVIKARKPVFCNMSYAVRPTTSELKKARRLIDQAVETYTYSVDVDNFEIHLSWQIFNEKATLISTDDKTALIGLNPEEDYSEEINNIVLMALLDMEFMSKAEYNKISFYWQEIAKFAYIKMRMHNLADTDLTVSQDLGEKEEQILEGLSDDIEEYNELLYTRTSEISEALAKTMLDEVEPEKVPQLKMSDIKKFGEKLF